MRKSINVDNAVWYTLKMEAFKSEMSLNNYINQILDNRVLSKTIPPPIEIPAVKEVSADRTNGARAKEVFGVGPEDDISKVRLDPEDEAELKAAQERLEKRVTNQKELDASREGRDIKRDKIAALKSEWSGGLSKEKQLGKNPKKEKKGGK
jgi:hypothetical protein